MEVAPGVNPHPGRVPEQELLTPETEFRMAADRGVNGSDRIGFWLYHILYHIFYSDSDQIG